MVPNIQVEVAAEPLFVTVADGTAITSPAQYSVPAEPAGKLVIVGLSRTVIVNELEVLVPQALTDL